MNNSFSYSYFLQILMQKLYEISIIKSQTLNEKVLMIMMNNLSYRFTI